MKGHPARCINTDEHLRLSGSGESDLNIYVRPIVERLVVGAVVKCRVGPFPENVSTNSHLTVPRLLSCWKVKDNAQKFAIKSFGALDPCN